MTVPNNITAARYVTEGGSASEYVAGDGSLITFPPIPDISNVSPVETVEGTSTVSGRPSLIRWSLVREFDSENPLNMLDNELSIDNCQYKEGEILFILTDNHKLINGYAPQNRNQL
jgi:hypothetical protein